MSISRPLRRAILRAPVSTPSSSPFLTSVRHMSAEPPPLHRAIVTNEVGEPVGEKENLWLERGKWTGVAVLGLFILYNLKHREWAGNLGMRPSEVAAKKKEKEGH